MKYLVFLLGVLLVSCNSNSTQEDKYEPITQTNFETLVEVVEEESSVPFYGFERFFFVKDSLGPILEDVKILADTYSNEKSSFTQLEKDSAYFIILEFMKQIGIAPEDDKALYEYNEVKETKIAKYYKEYGVLIESAEGEYYTEPSYQYLYDLFKDDVTEEFAVYIEFLVIDHKHIYDDGGLIISWMDLAKQILETEEFYVKLSKTSYEEELLEKYIGVCHSLMYGSENSLIIEPSSDSIYGLYLNVQLAYDMLINDPTHNSGVLFSQHLANLKLVNFNQTDEQMVLIKDSEIRKILNSY